MFCWCFVRHRNVPMACDSSAYSLRFYCSALGPCSSNARASNKVLSVLLLILRLACFLFISSSVALKTFASLMVGELVCDSITFAFQLLIYSFAFDFTVLSVSAAI